MFTTFKSSICISNFFFTTWNFVITLKLCKVRNNNKETYTLWKQANILEEDDKHEMALEIYIELFNNEKNNKEYFQKVKKILIKQKDFDQLLPMYEEHMNNIEYLNKNRTNMTNASIKYKFETEVELLEVKIWNKSENWQDYLYTITDKYTLNQNELILHKLIQNKKINEAYELVDILRKQHNKSSFFSRKLISILKKNNRYKEGIEECIVYLMDSSNTHSNFLSKKIIIEQIFEFSDELLEKALITNLYLPITSKQFTSNKSTQRIPIL